MKTKKLLSSILLFAFTLCFLLSNISTQAQPSNDTPCGATQVECGQTYSVSTFSATESGLPYPECSIPFFSTKDVFYKFTAYPNMTYIAVVQSFTGGLDDAVLAAYTGDCDGSLTEIGCAFDEGGSGNESLNFSVDNVQEVIIRTYDWEFEDEGGGGGSFQFLIDCQPVNDSPCDALTIECGQTLNGSTINAYTGEIDAPSCSAGSLEDVFYTFSALPGFTYQVQVNGPDYDAVLAAYSGSCSGTLTELACADEGVFIGIQEVISFSVDEEMSVIIRTYDWAENQGSFTISLNCTEVLDCPLLGLNIGDPCDDGNPDTNFDSISADCDCVGVSPCLGDIEWDSATLTGSDQIITISTNNLTGDFSPIFNASVGDQYTFVSTDNSGSDPVFITIRSGMVDGLVLGSGFSPLTITSDINGTLFAHFSTDELCDFTNIGTFTSTVQCITCPIYCPLLDAIEGDLCDDGDPSTTNDMVTTDCECEGVSPIPSNDLCENALELNVFAPGECTENLTIGTTDGATSSTSITTCEPENPDVFYSFNSGEYARISFSTTLLIATDIIMTIYEGDCEGEQIYCSTVLNVFLTVSPFTDYTVRLSTNLDFGDVGSFSICLEGGFDCTLLAANIGDACNDGNPETINDIITNDCNCLGEAPLTGSLSGSAEWNISCGNRSLTIEFYSPGTSTLLYSYSTFINQDGDFILGSGIAIGSYDIYVKIDGHLANGYLNEGISLGANTLLLGSFIPGDLNNNNGINITDFSLLNISFGSSEGDANFNFLADMNCDGNVNIIDVSILNIGFGMVGDMP